MSSTEDLAIFISALELLLPNSYVEVDAPAVTSGQYWLDVETRDSKFQIVWTLTDGFGVFSNDENAYGERPSELYQSPVLAVKRIAQLNARPESAGAMTLAELRDLRDVTQVELAETLNVRQPSISKFENGSDIKHSTLADFVEALGGTLEVVARFDEFQVVLQPGDARVTDARAGGKTHN